MTPEIKKTGALCSNDNIVILSDDKSKHEKYGLSVEEKNYAKTCIKNKDKLIVLNQFRRWIFIVIPEKGKEDYLSTEKLRNAAFSLHGLVKAKKITALTLVDVNDDPVHLLSFAEGLALSNYQFIRYFKDAAEKESKLKDIFISSESVSAKDLKNLNIIVGAVFHARNLVNEPSCFLNASDLATQAKQICGVSGCKVDIFEKKKIETLKMGGLLAVNRGSKEPPTFSLIEWNPKKAKNKKPFILVGKGIVFDTGGLSLKPTPGSMDAMKSDMGGAAAVIGAMFAISSARLPVHIIGLIPATDNRPGENAYAPQDIIRMHNGMHVEVMNCDAEGRLILADALSYAQQYKPELVIDLATLTGAATVATGYPGIVAMGTADETTFGKLKKSGFAVCERIVEFPLWEEYGEMIKSDTADIKNTGGREAGAITAGKFLEHFTGYPWIHLDIAGSAYLDKRGSYRGKAGTGVGVRLLFDFFDHYYQHANE